MATNDRVQLIISGIADSSCLPAMGPSKGMLREVGFKKGLALVDGDFITLLQPRARPRAAGSRAGARVAS